MAEDLDDILDGAATDDAAADLEAEFLKMLTENMEHLLAQPDAAAAAAGGAQQAAAVDEAGAIKTLEELRTAFESLSAVGSASGAGPSGAGASGAAGGRAAKTPQDFQGQIAQTMSKLRESSEKAAAQVAEDAKAAEDPAMASMMRDLEQLMQSENFDDIFSGFLDQLTKKEFLYDPLKDLADRYPAWLEANRSQLSPADNDRFDGQLEAVREILSKYDSIQGEPNEEQNKEILELLNKASLIQSFGNPPEALMKEMAPGLETDADGLPKMPQGACNPIDEYRISWQSRPRNVLLIKKPSDPKTASAMQTAIRWLQVNQPDTNIVVEATAAAELGLGSEHASVVSVETSDPSACAELVRTIDFVVTLGGDGTILHAASLFPKHVPPILSFSLGSLGFLLPFDVQIMNELTVHRGKHAQLTAIDIFVGSGFLTDVVLSATARGPAEVAVDGRDVCLLQHGQHIEVRPSAFAIPCVSRLSPASGWAHDIKQTLRWNQGFLNAGLLSHTS
nr:NADH kinase pos5 [Polyrhizophydium stewartii]